MKVVIEGKTIDVPRRKYVTAKTRQLVEFGYTTLTEKEVDEQIDAVLAGKTFGKGLTIIGKFMEDEVVREPSDSVDVGGEKIRPKAARSSNRTGAGSKSALPLPAPSRRSRRRG